MKQHINLESTEVSAGTGNKFPLSEKVIDGETRIIDLTVSDLQRLMLDVMKNQIAASKGPKVEEPDLVPIEIAMEITNYARSTIYGKVFNRTIPFTKKLRKLYFSRKKLLHWIQDGNEYT